MINLVRPIEETLQWYIEYLYSDYKCELISDKFKFVLDKNPGYKSYVLSLNFDGRKRL